MAPTTISVGVKVWKDMNPSFYFSHGKEASNAGVNTHRTVLYNFPFHLLVECSSPKPL